MGIFEEPRYVIKNVCNNFFEMPENTIREQTFCCGGSAGLGTDENMEMQAARRAAPGQRREVRAGKIRGQPTGLHLRHRPGDPATVCDYWAPGVQVTGITELVANAMVFPDEIERTNDLR